MISNDDGNPLIDESRIIRFDKFFSKDSIDEFEDNEFFYGKVIMDMATSHKDRYGDVLEQSFIISAAQQFLVEDTGFYNHKTWEDPMGAIKSPTAVQLDDGEWAVRMEFWIAKTDANKDRWKLLKAGILKKGSISFYIGEWSYDEDTDTLYIKSGEVVEGSIVGVPANPQAKIHEVIGKGFSISYPENFRKNLIKAHREKSLKTDNKLLNKNNVEEFTMDEAELKALIDQRIAEGKEKSKPVEPKVDYKALYEEEKAKSLDVEKAKSGFEAELEIRDKLLVKQEVEKQELEKALGKRKSSASHDDSDKVDKFYLDDKETALNLGFYEVGKLLQTKKEHAILLNYSSDSDRFAFADSVKQGVQI